MDSESSALLDLSMQSRTRSDHLLDQFSLPHPTTLPLAAAQHAVAAGKMPKALQHENRIALALGALSSGQIRSIRKAAATFDMPFSTPQKRRAGRVSRQQSQVGHRN